LVACGRAGDAFQAFEFGYGYGSGFRNCSRYWDAVGTPTTACDDCLFAFDVELIYDAALSMDDGSCADSAMDTRFSYAFREDYPGYGSYILVGYDSGFYAWASATFEGENLHYTTGVDDYPRDDEGPNAGDDYPHFTQGHARVY